MAIWYVAVGGAVGSMCRFLLGAAVQQRVHSTFPAGTFLINVTGSLLLGFLVRTTLATGAVSPEVRLMLTTGLCGGYTTFSTFTFETAELLEDGAFGQAALYIAASILVALVGMFLGFSLARWLIAIRAR